MKINPSGLSVRLLRERFKWNGKYGKADFKELPITEIPDKIVLTSLYDEGVIKFSNRQLRYWTPMGSDGMYEISGHEYTSDCGNYVLTIKDLHDMGKRI